MRMTESNFRTTTVTVLNDKLMADSHFNVGLFLMFLVLQGDLGETSLHSFPANSNENALNCNKHGPLNATIRSNNYVHVRIRDTLQTTKNK